MAAIKKVGSIFSVILICGGLLYWSIYGQAPAGQANKAGPNKEQNIAQTVPTTKIAPNLNVDKDTTHNANTFILLNVILSSPRDKAFFVRHVHNMGGEVIDQAEDNQKIIRVKVPAASLNKITVLEQVEYVEKYEQPNLFNDRAANISGAKPLNAQDFVVPGGLTGRGQLVAVADTGLDTGVLGTLQQDFRGKVKKLQAFYKDGPTGDKSGHGTHVAGTIAGSGAASDGKYSGMAPGAELFIQSIINSKGEAVSPLDLQSLFAPAYQAGARIHVDSWGGSSNNYLASSMQTDEFIRKRPDFLVLFGAGNSGPGQGSVGPEANSKNALVIGAAESSRPGYGRDADNPAKIADLSSRGPTGDGRIKPDLVAPGTAIISNASSLVKTDPYKVDDFYTRKSGTSMATAVAAGAAALLREYLIESEKNTSPSAALLKATLVNGADRMEDGLTSAGFGRINIAATVLALKEDTMQLVDEKAGLTPGGSRRYTCNIQSSDAPFKASLAWTDPPARPGADKTLVNNLDLVVIDPDGRIFYGNDFENRHIADSLNNVEQVEIPSPKPGKYTIKVVGTGITQNAVANNGENDLIQDYALVYGAPLGHAVAARANQDGSQVLLNGGGILRANKSTHVAAVDTGLIDNSKEEKEIVNGMIKTGSDLYFVGSRNHPKKIYAAYRTESINGIRGTAALGQSGLLEGINGDAGGGFLLAQNEPGPLLTSNGQEIKNLGDIVAGADVIIKLNPSTELVWQADASYQLLNSYLVSIDRNKLLLQNSKESLQLAPNVAIYQNVKWLAQLPYWTPFSYTPVASMSGLAPGDKVRVTVSPATGQVTSIEHYREALVGVFTGYDAAGGNITLSTGESLIVEPKAKILRDGQETTANKLMPGDHIEASLLPDSSRVWTVNAFSNILFGKVIFFNEAGKSLLVLNEKGNYGEYQIQSDAKVYWQGRDMGNVAIKEGDYIRLGLDENNRVWRVDVATPAGKHGTSVVFESYDPSTRYMQTDSGEKFLVTERTAILKDGIPLLPGDLIAGEKIIIDAAVSTINGDKVLGFIIDDNKSTLAGPKFELSVPEYVNTPEVTVTGTADAGSRLHLYVNRGPPLDLPLNGQTFSVKLQLKNEGPNLITVVAVNPSTGGVTSREFTVYWAEEAPDFTDLVAHWARPAIKELAARGVVNGYPDGSFRPNQTVSRVEFVRMLVGAMGWNTDINNGLPFQDAGKISKENLPYISAAFGRGLVRGYPEDETFRPGSGISRAEMAVIIYRALQVNKDLIPEAQESKLSDAEIKDIPAWAGKAAAFVYSCEIMTGRGGLQGFAPMEAVTRAEAASALWRMLEFCDHL